LPPWELHPLAKQSREEQSQEDEEQPSDDGRPSTAPSSRGDFVLAIYTGVGVCTQPVAVSRKQEVCRSGVAAVDCTPRPRCWSALPRCAAVPAAAALEGGAGRVTSGRAGCGDPPTRYARVVPSDLPILLIFGVSLCVRRRRAVRWLPSSRRAARPRPSRRRPCWPTARWLARRAATAAPGSAARGSRSSGRREATQSRKRSQCERMQAVYCNNQTQVT